MLYSVLDKSMSGWRSNSTKADSLPYLFGPQKLVNFGRMLKSGVESKRWILVFQDVDQGREDQDLMKQIGKTTLNAKKGGSEYAIFLGSL